jgi:serine/threonine protein kinase
MGRVHRAADDELSREVAYKDIKPEYADSEAARQRFVFEAEVTGRLEHPGIVPVYGLGRGPGGRPYYAMRFIDGQTLGEAAAELHAADAPADRTLALRRLLNRFVSVCQTVAFAHSRGVIHRDLKPANIMFGPFGETLVLDWGIAKRVRAAPGELEAAPAFDPRSGAADRTQRIGTPGYWAPEQAAERPDRHDERTDVYGLGAVLFHVLTGRAPHPDGRHPPDPPSPRAARPWVDEVLDAVTRRALAHDPEDRYPTAGEVAAEVERWLADQPVAAQRAAVAALADRARAYPADHGLAEQLARQRANLGLMLGGMGRDAAAADELRAAAAVFARLVAERSRPRYLADEANCHLALARCWLALGRPGDADAANRRAADLYRGLVADRPGGYRSNYADIMLTLAGPVPSAVPAATPPPQPEAGTVPIGGYTMLRELGRGAMASVWLARDDATGREVAVKVLSAALHPRARERFFREGEVTAGLEHPNIIRVHAWGERSDGKPYLVTEYLDGSILSWLIWRSDGGPDPALLEAHAQVCDGLHHAHTKGVVHRDPKPSNVIVLPAGRAVLLDWGVAKVVGRAGGDFDAAGDIIGTPAYMAPEQARGEHAAVGPHTDVYVVGAGLFETLTGERALPGGSVLEALERSARGEVPRPREVQPDVPAELDAICARAMAFRPEDRYPTAAALAADLRAYLAR